MFFITLTFFYFSLEKSEMTDRLSIDDLIPSRIPLSHHDQKHENIFFSQNIIYSYKNILNYNFHAQNNIHTEKKKDILHVFLEAIFLDNNS